MRHALHVLTGGRCSKTQRFAEDFLQQDRFLQSVGRGKVRAKRPAQGFDMKMAGRRAGGREVPDPGAGRRVVAGSLRLQPGVDVVRTERM